MFVFQLQMCTNGGFGEVYKCFYQDYKEIVGIILFLFFLHGGANVTDHTKL